VEFAEFIEFVEFVEFAEIAARDPSAEGLAMTGYLAHCEMETHRCPVDSKKDCGI
jgi:hypothetical protein